MRSLARALKPRNVLGSHTHPGLAGQPQRRSVLAVMVEGLEMHSLGRTVAFGLDSALVHA